VFLLPAVPAGSGPIWIWVSAFARPAIRQAFANTLRQTVHDLDPRVELLQTLLWPTTPAWCCFRSALASSLLVLLGLVALVLAAMGVYAVMAYAVSQRTQEFGLRIALGASSGDVLRLVLGKGLLMAASGLAVGLVAFAGRHAAAGRVSLWSESVRSTHVRRRSPGAYADRLVGLLPARPPRHQGRSDDRAAGGVNQQ